MQDGARSDREAYFQSPLRSRSIRVKAKSPALLSWLRDFTDQHGQTLTHSANTMRSLTKQGPEMAEFCIKMLCSLVSRSLLQV